MDEEEASAEVHVFCCCGLSFLIIHPTTHTHSTHKTHIMYIQDEPYTTIKYKLLLQQHTAHTHIHMLLSHFTKSIPYEGISFSARISLVRF
jgi:hypothetical protein